jgi:hypothetical protein
MFVHIIKASDYSVLNGIVKDIRREISTRQTTDPDNDDNGNTCLGDLGQHCETLLERYERATNHPDEDVERIPEYSSSNGSDQSLIATIAADCVDDCGEAFLRSASFEEEDKLKWL